MDVCRREGREITPAHDSHSQFTSTTDQQSQVTPQLHTRNSKEEGPKSVCIKEEMLESDLEVRDQEDKVNISGDEGREKPFACTQRGKSFANSSNLKVHQRVHTGQKPFTCMWCGKNFAYLVTLSIHQTVHTGDKPFRCMQCGKTFANSSNLKVHQRVHTGQKLFTCAQCGKNFTHLSTLNLHQMVHTGQTPFICS